MASLLGASYGLGQAARCAAPAARGAALSGSGGPDLLLHSSPIAATSLRSCLFFSRGGSPIHAPPLGRAMSYHTDEPAACNISASTDSPPTWNMADASTGLTPVSKLHESAPGTMEFAAVEKDLESDEALWVLYERWCKAFNQKRDHDEMLSRFDKFKENVLAVDRANKANLPYTSAINHFADGKLAELCSPKVPILEFIKKMPYSDSVIYGKAEGILFEEDGPKEQGDDPKEPKEQGDDPSFLFP